MCSGTLRSVMERELPLPVFSVYEISVAGLQEERDQRKAKKQQRRQQRQNIEEPELPVFLEAKPSLTYPQEMWVEPDYDSDEVEHEQMKVPVQQFSRAAARILLPR